MSRLTLTDFLRGTLSGGPAIAVSGPPVTLPLELRHGVVVRRLDGTTMLTSDGFFDAYAQAWEFPDYFWHGLDSFNDCIGDLDGHGQALLTETGATPGGFLTIIDDADDVLIDAEPNFLDFVARQHGEWRDLYRTPNAYGADRPVPLEFGLVLVGEPGGLALLRRRWTVDGVKPAVLLPERPLSERPRPEGPLSEDED